MIAAPGRPALPERLLIALAVLTLAGTTTGAAAGLVRTAILFPSLAGALYATAGLLLAAVLILAITNHQNAGLERMPTANEGYVVTDGDVGSRRQ